jgi:hypothetical protein
MKLYELHRNNYFVIENDPSQEVFLFDHIDGMYSVCYDLNKNTINFAAWTPVNIVKPVKTYAGGQPHYVQVQPV